MSFGLRRKRVLSTEGVGVGPAELPPLPDDPGSAARVDPRMWFPDPARPLDIEIGSGKGTFLLQEAARDPATNYLGIERAAEFYEYAADRCRRAGLGNVRLLNADAAEFLKWRCADGVARIIHLYFPDPWPKTRHHKRRIVSGPFLREAWRVLEPSGELRIVTDHEDYWAWMGERFGKVSGARGQGPGEEDIGHRAQGAGKEVWFERVPFERSDSAREGELVGTNFERKYRREGRPFFGAVLRKTS